MGRRNLGQMKCNRCRRWHLACYQAACISDETWAELQAYAKENGRSWKSKLRDAWTRGDDVLQWARNIIGPRNLDSVKPDAKRYGRR